MQLNVNNEQKVLAYFFKNPSKWNDLESLEEYFLAKTSKQICKALINQSNNNIIIFDIDTLYNTLVNDGNEISKDVLNHIDSAFTQANIEEALNTLKADKTKFKLNNVLLEDLYVDINSKSQTSLDNIEKTANKILDEVNKLKQDVDILLHTDTLVEKYWEKSEIRKNEKLRTTIGYEALDKLLTTPAQPREMTAIVAQKGSGKCLKFSTLILTEKGFERIGEYSENVDGFIEKKVKVLNKEKFVEASHFYEEEVNQTIKIQSSFGFEIEGTENHPMYVFNGINFEWKRLEDCQKDDTIIIKKGSDVYNKKLYRINYTPSKKFFPNCKDWKNNVTIINKDIARMLGYLVANGFICQRFKHGQAYGFCSKNKKIVDDLTNIAQQLGVSLCINSPYHYMLGATKFGDFLDYLFDNKFSTARYKQVPKCILQSPKEIQLEFLKALFDCDSYLNKRFILEYYTASKELVQMIQMMLLNMNIFSYTRKKFLKRYNHTYYNLYISGQDLFNLIELFSYKSNKYNYNDFVKRYKKKFNSNIKTYPKVKELIIDKIKEYKKVKGNNKKGLHIPDNLRYPSEITYTTIKLMYDLLSHYNADFFKDVLQILKEIIDNNYMFDKIILKDIIKESTKVYDFSIPDGHNFYSNGLISHNSTFATNIANRLISMDVPVLLILLEEDYQKIIDRIISMRTRIPFLNLRRGKYGEAEEAKMYEVTDMLKATPKFFIADHSTLDIKGVRRLIKQVQKIIGQEYMVVIIDVTSMLTDFSMCKTPKEITSKVDQLHALNKETGVHIINILQENENRWRANKVTLKNLKFFKPSMADIKDASAYAERCRVVIYLWNESYIKKVFVGEDEEEEEIGPPKIEARIIKQNDGEVGVGVTFLFDTDCCRMSVFYKDDKEIDDNYEKK